MLGGVARARRPLWRHFVSHVDSSNLGGTSSARALVVPLAGGSSLGPGEQLLEMRRRAAPAAGETQPIITRFRRVRTRAQIDSWAPGWLESLRFGRSDWPAEECVFLAIGHGDNEPTKRAANSISSHCLQEKRASWRRKGGWRNGAARRGAENVRHLNSLRLVYNYNGRPLSVSFDATRRLAL